MRDHLLFAVFPYLGGLVFVAGSVVPLVRRRFDPLDAPAASRGAFDTAWRLALAAVGIAHVVTLAFPNAALRWDREYSRLVFLEAARIAAGALAAAGAVAVLARLLRPAPDGTRRSVDVIAATLLVTATVSGLAVAIVYRWASAWAAVTLAPYLSSLAHFDPATELIAHLPLIVKLHVVSAIAILTVLPFTGPARAFASRLTRRARRQAAPPAFDEPRSKERDATN